MLTSRALDDAEIQLKRLNRVFPNFRRWSRATQVAAAKVLKQDMTGSSPITATALFVLDWV